MDRVMLDMSLYGLLITLTPHDYDTDFPDIS